ncbi:RNA demethylase ALKBH10B-like [Bidens hawaiensis]|uniref:RNA demethylase ALKBH10B-like n=1 Tax=Bidens hawaiensis TaxID=980011 RepID=UPI00404B66F3
MAPVTTSSSSSDVSPALLDYPTRREANNANIAWFQGEFAAANAIIDALCDHLSKLDNGDQYEPVFNAVHRRRMNWIPVLHMQKYYSIADIAHELLKVKDIDNDRCNGVDSPKSEVTDAESEEVQPLVENIKICSNLEDWEARRTKIKMTKGFIAKECVEGHMVNVVRGLKLYENILSNTELTRLNDYINKLQIAGQNGELSGETFISYNKQSKAINRELIQFGAPIFGLVNDGVTNKSQNSHIEPIPAALEGVIDHLIKYRLISEDRRPNSCIINFFDKGEFSQPFLKPPHVDEPISTLILSNTSMAFGHALVCDKDRNYKGPLTFTLNEGSLLVMRGNSADVATHATCQSPTKRTSITFFKVFLDSCEKNSLSPPTEWGPPQLPMLAPVHPMALTPQCLSRGGTGVFLPCSVGSRKPQKNLPPRAQKERLFTVESSAEPSDVDPASGH